MPPASRAHPSPPLRFRLLGGFNVWVGDRAVPDEAFRLRRAKSLIKLLALAPERRLHRDRVSELLWPQGDIESFANSFHQVVYSARRALDAAGAAAGECLELHEQSLVLGAMRDVEVDVEQFEAAARRARTTRSVPDYEVAIDLYRGELLPEDIHESWSTAKRLALKELRAALLLEIADLHARDGRSAAAVELVQRALTEDPMHEAAHRMLMRLFTAAGRRQQALLQYQELSATLHKELDAKPDVETRRLHREILALDQGPAEPGEPTLPASALRGRATLPLSLTSFIGRERERAEVNQFLDRTRLLTLVGPGGCGKTRLALEAARARVSDFEDGAFFVDLAPITDAGLVANETASVLGIQLRSEREPTTVIAEQIRDHAVLLLLDNCEHLIDACAHLLDRLLRSCPRLRVLATSREPLRVEGEIAWRVPSLSLPSPSDVLEPDRLSNIEAIRLFAERATGTAPGFQVDRRNAAAVAEICHHLDGMPLAIELAAARVGALAPDQIAERLKKSLAVLGGGNRAALTRQQTLTATIGWSYDLLTDQERTLFRRLTVFAGTFSLEAAEEVCVGQDVEHAGVADVLARLVEKSLVLAGDNSGVRSYRLLETVRQYGAQCLSVARERDAIDRRHRKFYAAFAATNDPELSDAPDALDRLEREHDNLRAALTSALDHEPEQALELCTHLTAFWLTRGHFAEGARWLDEALARAGSRTGRRARALLCASALAVRRGKLDHYRPYAYESIAISRETVDHRALAEALLHVSVLQRPLGTTAEVEGFLAETEAIALALGDAAAEAAVHHDRGLNEYGRGDCVGAVSRFRRAVDLLRRAGDSPNPVFPAVTLGSLVLEEAPHPPRCYFENTIMVFRRVGARAAIGWALSNLANALRSVGDLEAARPPLDEALAIFQEKADAIGTSLVLSAQGNLARSSGELDRGRGLLERALAIRRRQRDLRSVGMSLANLALLEARASDFSRARALIAESLGVFARTGDMAGTAAMQINLGNIELAAGAWQAAAQALEVGLSNSRASATPWGDGWAWMAFAEGALRQGDAKKAARHLAHAREVLEPLADPRAASHAEDLERRIAAIEDRITTD